MTVYLNADTLIRINDRQEGGIGVRDCDGVESVAHRPAASAFGQEKFPTVWLKAAAYAHGIASTQYFFDGNKRTAWLAAQMFLEANGRELPVVPDIEAEFFINAVAMDAWRADGEDATIEGAAEWLENKWRSHRVGPACDDGLEYIFISGPAAPAADSDGVLDISYFAMSGVTIVGDFDRFALPFQITGRYHFTPDQVRGTGHRFTAAINAADSTAVRPNRHTATEEADDPPPSGHPHDQRTGLLPLLFTLRLDPIFKSPGRYTIRVEMDGALIAEIPFAVHHVEETPDTPAGLYITGS